MADDINKTISVDIEVNPDGLQQVAQYKAAFDNLNTSINSLSKPLESISSGINSIDKGITDTVTSVNTLTSALTKTGQESQKVTANLGKDLNQNTADGAKKAMSWIDRVFKLWLKSSNE